MTRCSTLYRTMRPPGSFIYYMIFGGYLLALALLGRSSSHEGRLLVVERLRWTDLSAYLTWITGRVGLPSAFSVALESKLLGRVGVIEPTMSAFIKNQRGQVFVDVGSYHGHYSLLLSGNFERVIAIEPVPENADFLRRVVNYRRARNIRILEIAASNQAGRKPIRLMPQLSESRLELQRPIHGPRISARTDTLDSTLAGIDEVDLVKVDVEGAEFEVMDGARHSTSKIRSWLIELHDLTQKTRLEQRLFRSGYHLLWLDRGHVFASRENDGRR